MITPLQQPLLTMCSRILACREWPTESNHGQFANPYVLMDCHITANKSSPTHCHVSPEDRTICQDNVFSERRVVPHMRVAHQKRIVAHKSG